MSEIGRIKKIRVYSHKGHEGTELSQAELSENDGIAGERERPAEKQVSLMFTENFRQLKKEYEGFCITRYKENILIDSNVQVVLKPGTVIKAGNVILEVSSATKNCFEDCPKHKNGIECSLAGKNLFAKARKGGIINTGDKVLMEQGS
jgi:MOSC domain-containing protein YiiM